MKKPTIIHIPKTGGMAIRETLGDAIVCDGHNTYPRMRALGIIPDPDRVITVVRDPVDRCCSAYNQLYGADPSAPDGYWTQLLRDYSDDPQDAFEKLLDDLGTWSMTCTHFMPQFAYLLQPNNTYPNIRYIPYPKLQNLWPEVCEELYHRQYKLTRLNEPETVYIDSSSLDKSLAATIKDVYKRDYEMLRDLNMLDDVITYDVTTEDYDGTQ